MKLSVIVPTHERGSPLTRCLATLQDQTLDVSQYEVIVVDDGSVTDVAGLVREARRDGGMALRCERQDHGGLNRARNRGVQLAAAPAVAFLDDDTLVDPGWAEAIVRAFRDPSCSGVGGRIDLATDAPVPDWIARCDYYLGAYDLGPVGRWLSDDDPVPVGANCAVRRDLIAATGGFIPGLDRMGGSLVSNGDTEFFRRVLRHGARLRYEPGARVDHCVPPGRLTTRWMARRHRAQGVSDELLQAMARSSTIPARRRAVAARLPLELRHALKVLIRDLAAGRGPVGTYLELNYWAGRLTGAGLSVRDLGPAPMSLPGLAPAEPPQP